MDTKILIHYHIKNNRFYVNGESFDTLHEAVDDRKVHLLSRILSNYAASKCSLGQAIQDIESVVKNAENVQVVYHD